MKKLINELFELIDKMISKVNDICEASIKLSNIFIIQRIKKPYKKEDILIIDEETGKSIDISDTSPLISSLINPKNDDPPFYIFYQLCCENS